jgi:PAS domain S-box-containing protein
MHSLLRRQLRRHFGSDAAIPPTARSFVEAVDAAYQEADAERAMLERSLEISSTELIESNAELRALLGALPDVVLRFDRRRLSVDEVWGGGVLSTGVRTRGDSARADVPLPHDVVDTVEKAARAVSETGRAVAFECASASHGAARVHEARLLSLPDGHVLAVVREVSELADARRELEKSLAIARSTLESTADAIIVVDVDGRHVSSNHKFEEMWGVSSTELADASATPPLARISARMTSPAEFVARVSDLAADLRSATAGTFELADGRFLEVHSEATFRGPGLIGRVWSFRDVTNRKRAEASLRLFRALVDESSDAIEVIDPATGRFLDVNQRDCLDLGYSREEMLAFRVFDVDATISPAAWEERIARVRTDGALRAEGTHRRKDGTSFPVEINARWVRLDREYLVTIVRDITERRRAEASLRASEERFRQMAENIDGVFWMTDPGKNRMLYVSPGYERIWGRSTAGLLANPHSWLDAVHPDDRSRAGDAALNAQLRGDYDETYRIRRPDGAERWIRDRAFVVRGADGEVSSVVGIAEDITDRRRVEQQLRQAQKMQAIGTLAGGIAHDFNNILAAVVGYAELAQRCVAADHVAGRHLEAVIQGGMRAADLVRQILTFSRQQEQTRRPLQLGRTVSEPLRLLRATIPSSIKFELSLAAAVPSVLADATQIHQVVMNLCTNAAHAMRDRPGVLRVRLETVEVDASMAKSTAGLRVGTYAMLTVADTGHGMNCATLEHIFEPFFTTKDPSEGTGLGLSVVHGIVCAHDGAVEVSSCPGEGTTFRLYFPAISGDAVVASESKTEAPRGRGQRVLFVDDEAALAALGEAILTELGYVVESRTDPIDALAAVRADPTRFDLVVTDQAMPGMNGMELARKLQKIRRGIPILILTGNGGALSPSGALEHGVRAVLTKPVGIRTLGFAVGRELLA